jgi:hypothetical protein
MKIALHTRVRADRIDEYERAPHDYSAAGGDAVLPVVWQL